MKIRPVGAKLFHAGGQTNMTKGLVSFRNFANARKKMEAMDVLLNVDRGVRFMSLPCKQIRISFSLQEKSNVVRGSAVEENC
jgi:hypothetical protein